MCSRYFVKLRLTFKDDHKMREMMKETVQVLADSVESALGMIGSDKKTEELREIDVDRPGDRKSNGRLFVSNDTSENFELVDYESHTFLVLGMVRVCLPLLWPWYCEDMNDPNARGAIFRTWGSDEPTGDEIANIIVADATGDPTEPDVSIITGADIAKTDNYLESETAKALAEQEMKLTKWMGSEQKQCGNNNCLISRYIASDQGQSKCIIAYRQTIKDRKIVALGCFNVDLKEILEEPILSALEGVIPVNYDLGADYASNTNLNDSEWVLVNEFGDSKIYVDKASIQKSGSIVMVSVRYDLNPPGTDKRNDKPVKEMLMLEEYNISNGEFRLHNILFTYTDESLSEPLSVVPTWSTATAGNLKTLQFLQNQAAKLAETNKSKWWKFWE